ncbi:hypothetical protein HU200_066557 [Digitaria exilis]|uniref:Uncharacterized protein n=1 Tax=Digitaria exilis TaxID=1010633 RepID=A0A835DST9_9POAL|nr:hypothetical protein HU200_066557 [Digitaria exilis]
MSVAAADYAPWHFRPHGLTRSAWPPPRGHFRDAISLFLRMRAFRRAALVRARPPSRRRSSAAPPRLPRPWQPPSTAWPSASGAFADASRLTPSSTSTASSQMIISTPPV